MKVANELYRYGISSIMDYSVEGQESEEELDHVKDEILSLIPLSKQHPNEIPIVVFKPTGCGSIDIFEKVGFNLPMSQQKKQKWEKIKTQIEEERKTAQDHRETNMKQDE